MVCYLFLRNCYFFVLKSKNQFHLYCIKATSFILYNRSGGLFCNTATLFLFYGFMVLELDLNVIPSAAKKKLAADRYLKI